MDLSATRPAKIRPKIRDQLVKSREPIDFFLIAIVAMIPFSRLIVVTNQSSSISAIIQAVLERVT